MKNVDRTIEILERERESSSLKNKKVIALVALEIILLLFVSGISVYANIRYLATQVDYTRNGTNIKNVSEALNDLYTKMDLTSQTQATATASDILSGKTAWVNGKQVQGTLPSTGKGALWNADKTNMTKVNKHNYCSFDIGFNDPSRVFIQMHNEGKVDALLMIEKWTDGNYYCYNSGSGKSGDWVNWTTSNWSLNNSVVTLNEYGDGQSIFDNADIYWYAIK